jgi:fatty-acid desaturase
MLFSRLIIIAAFSSLLALFLNAEWTWIVGSLVYYKIVVGFFGNQIAQHRYFSHNSFKTTKFKSYFLYFVSLTTGVNPLDYALVHRHHHIHSDTKSDLHSWRNSIADIFFPLTGKSTYTGNIKISAGLNKELRKINKWYQYIIISIITILTLINWKISVFLFLAGIAWNYIHMILFRVVLVHAKLPGSYRSYDTADNSWNNKYIQLLDIGEGLHNNHHAFPNKFDQAINPNEFDLAGAVVRKFLL